MSEQNLKKYIAELIQEIQQELDEMSTTGNVDGYNTPHAFSRKKDKERRKKNATQLGYELVDNDVDNISEAQVVNKKTGKDITKHVLDLLSGKINQKQFEKLTGLKKESVNEAKVKRPVNRWLELKNDETMHPHKKMAMGLKELKYQLAETEKFFKWYNKIKTMNELDSQNYWKRTNNHIYKIKERLINIARTLHEIEK